MDKKYIQGYADMTDPNDERNYKKEEKKERTVVEALELINRNLISLLQELDSSICSLREEVYVLKEEFKDYNRRH